MLFTESEEKYLLVKDGFYSQHQLTQWFPWSNILLRNPSWSFKLIDSKVTPHYLLIIYTKCQLQGRVFSGALNKYGFSAALTSYKLSTKNSSSNLMKW